MTAKTMDDVALSLHDRERAVVYACIYLGCLFLATTLFWFLMLVGGNPYTPQPGIMVDGSGVPTKVFHSGDLVGLERTLCSAKNTSASFFPVIKSQTGAMMPLPPNISSTPRGCHPYTYGLTVPNVPPGIYQIVTTVKFQSNLVGRDEFTTMPPVFFEVTKS
jgi:hypothetical protein